METYWDEPEYLQKIREMTSKFERKIGSNSLKAFSNAHKIAGATAGLGEVTRIMESIKHTYKIDTPIVAIEGFHNELLDNLGLIQSAKLAGEMSVHFAKAFGSTYGMQNSLKRMFENQSFIKAVANASTLHGNYGKLFQSIEFVNPIISAMKNMSLADSKEDNNPENFSFLEEYVQRFDFDSLEVYEDTLTYDGRAYSCEDLERLYADESDALKRKETLRERFEKNSVIFVMGFIITIFLSLQQFHNTIIWSGEQIRSLQATIMPGFEDVQENAYAYTIKENSYLRAMPDARSEVMARLVFDTQLRILSTDVPRWIEVEYITCDGRILIGWISKISVEMA